MSNYLVSKGGIRLTHIFFPFSGLAEFLYTSQVTLSKSAVAVPLVLYTISYLKSSSSAPDKTINANISLHVSWKGSYKNIQ